MKVCEFKLQNWRILSRLTLEYDRFNELQLHLHLSLQSYCQHEWGEIKLSWVICCSNCENGVVFYSADQFQPLDAQGWLMRGWIWFIGCPWQAEDPYQTPSAGKGGRVHLFPNRLPDPHHFRPPARYRYHLNPPAPYCRCLGAPSMTSDRMLAYWKSLAFEGRVSLSWHIHRALIQNSPEIRQN